MKTTLIRYAIVTVFLFLFGLSSGCFTNSTNSAEKKLSSREKSKIEKVGKNLNSQLRSIRNSFNKGNYEKVVSNIQEVKARGGRIISIVTEGDSIVKELTDYCIEIPNCFEELSPLLTNIPLQLLSYHIAVLRGCDVDQPRNLAKSVTVE